MGDLFLATASLAGQPQYPPQTSPVPFFFGEGTNDLQIGTNNDFTLVSGLDETIQDVQKILLTEQGTNPVFPYYGTTLQSSIGQKINLNVIGGQVQDQITTALQILYVLTQNRTVPSEIVQTLYSLKTSVQNETSISCLLTIIAANGQEITTGVNIGNI